MIRAAGLETFSAGREISRTIGRGERPFNPKIGGTERALQQAGESDAFPG
jgi:hypothetical protein